jgi:hypothetical protein
MSLLQRNRIFSNTTERENNTSALRRIDHIYFVICNSCYWCASYFRIDALESSLKVLRCHVCNSYDTVQIPIFTN